MSALSSKVEEPAEAVIISGPRKGEFIAHSSTGEEVATPEAVALVDEMLATAKSITETMQAMRRDGEAFRAEMCEREKKRHELLRAIGKPARPKTGEE